MARKYFPLHCHSHYSLLDGLSKPEDMAARIVQTGLEGSALTDHGTISGAIQFLDKMKAEKLKPVLGCEFYVSKDKCDVKSDTNRKLSHIVVLAKNDAGWKDLVRMVSISNHPDHFYYKPRIDKEILAEYAQKGNLLAFSGHLGSHMASSVLDENMDLHPLWRKLGEAEALWFKEIFGQNFWLEVQLMDHKANPLMNTVAHCMREISHSTGIPKIATPDAHYPSKEDAIDQRILLCTNLRTTMSQASKPEFGMSGFFRSDNYHIPSYEEMLEWHTEEELANTLNVADSVEEYTDILKPPILPPFQCPNGMNADDYLKDLCRAGWREKIAGIVPSNQHQEYADRVKYELSVLQGAGLSSYFLIVQDIVNYVRNKQWLPGPGRGSAAGCLVSYLIGITSIDPMPYGLIFERFYNAGRNTADRVSMPDIDVDVPKYSRDAVIQYIRDKYGNDKVGQMITYQTMKGSGAIKAVLRAYGGMSFDEMNRLTKNIIADHKISDELQQMKEDTGESSILRWCLENTGEKLKEWCYLNEEGDLDGPLANEFAQAMRLEGTKSAQSKHAAGVVIAPAPLSEICPMVLDTETKKMLVGLEMEDTESVGGIKFDILGVAMLDKIMGVQSELQEGYIREIQGF